MPIVLFDLDGTLTDSAPGIIGGLRAALSEMGITPPDETELRTFLGPPLAVTFAERFDFDATQIDEAIAHYRRYYHHGGELENSVYEGIPEVLEHLRSANVTLAVATSKPTVSAARILEHFDLTGYFTVIAGAELDGSRQHKAEVIAHALDELGDPSHGAITMVGDREHDVRGAASHGIPTLRALWGYGSEQELHNAGAELLVAHPRALIDVFTAQGIITS